MARRRGSLQFLLWAFVSTLVLKAAVPLLAAGAAQLQGVPVGSICGIYGVTLPGKADPHAHHHAQHHAHHGHDAPAGDDAPAHGGSHREHCALTGLASMALPDVATAPSLPATAALSPPQRRAAPRCGGDACAAWAARMQHPPPAAA
jgi:hypothetical protein